MGIRLVKRAALLLRVGRRESLTRWAAWAALVAALVLALVLSECVSAPPERRVASFNIENFPKHARQVEGAFAHIERLRVGVVGVQEIIKPGLFRSEARDRLGSSWDFAWSSSSSPQRVGVLYDTALFTFVEQREHRQPMLHRGARPALEVVLQPRGGGSRLRVVVLHLKAGGEHAALRRRQLEALRPVVAELLTSEDEVLVLGDFNSTGEEDRRTLAQWSDALGVGWSTRRLGCTSYWSRPDGCLGTPLDHVMSRVRPRRVFVGGACAESGCEPGASCPVYCEEVSDHCPVVVELP